jgi:hypothetical protein
MDYNRINGRLGQVCGPFAAGEDLLATGGAIDVFTKEKTKPNLLKLGIQAPVDSYVSINNVNIKIGKTGIYELDYRVVVKSLSFPDGADETVIVDFVY